MSERELRLRKRIDQLIEERDSARKLAQFRLERVRVWRERARLAEARLARILEAS